MSNNIIEMEPVREQEKTIKRKQFGTSKEMMDIQVRRPELVKRILVDICKEEAFICGGFARVACSPLDNPIPSKDIDIYLLDEKNFEIVENRIKESLYILIKSNDVSHIYGYALDTEGLQLNLIKPIRNGHLYTFGAMDEILQNFDFSVARVGIYLQNGDIRARGDVDFEEDELHKRLNIKNIHCPIAEVARIAKYQKKGYHCPLVMVLRCFLDWEGRDMEFKQSLVSYLIAKEELTTQDMQELYKKLYID